MWYSQLLISEDIYCKHESFRNLSLMTHGKYRHSHGQIWSCAHVNERGGGGGGGNFDIFWNYDESF